MKECMYFFNISVKLIYVGLKSIVRDIIIIPFLLPNRKNKSMKGF